MSKSPDTETVKIADPWDVAQPYIYRVDLKNQLNYIMSFNAYNTTWWSDTGMDSAQTS